MTGSSSVDGFAVDVQSADVMTKTRCNFTEDKRSISGRKLSSIQRWYQSGRQYLDFGMFGSRSVTLYRCRCMWSSFLLFTSSVRSSALDEESVSRTAWLVEVSSSSRDHFWRIDFASFLSVCDVSELFPPYLEHLLNQDVLLPLR